MCSSTKKEGSALIYVIILLIPVMLVALFILDMTSTNLSVSSGVVEGQQALNNAEAGYNLAVKRLQMRGYDGSFKGYNSGNSYTLDGKSYNTSRNALQYRVEYLSVNRIFKIYSTGKYGDAVRELYREINLWDLPNLSRKFISGSLVSSIGRVSFQISPSNGDSLNNNSKFLITGFGELNDGLNIYTYYQGQTPEEGSRSLYEGLFHSSTWKQGIFPRIEADIGHRNQWISYTPSIKYYVSQSNSQMIIDLERIKGGTDIFFQGFREYSGNIYGGILQSDTLRAVFIDGDLIIRGIRGDYGEFTLTNAERYLNNLFIYCTGKLTIEDCDIRACRGGIEANRDLDFCFSASEIEFISNSGENNIVSYLEKNKGLIRDNEEEVINLIKGITTPYSNWIKGY